MKIRSSAILVTACMALCVNGAIWESGESMGNGYFSLDPLGEYYWQPGYGNWAHHSWLGWIEARSESLESFEFFRMDGDRFNRGDLFWTSAEQFPIVYSLGRYESGQWEETHYWGILESTEYCKSAILRSGDQLSSKTRILWIYRYDTESWEYLGDRQRELPFEKEFKNGDLDSVREALVQKAVTPLPEASRNLLPQAFQEAYSLYETFFDPTVEGSYYADDELYVIPGELAIRIYEQIAKHTNTDYYGYNLLYEMTLNPFQPNLEHLGKTIISKDAYRTRQLEEFLHFDNYSDQGDRAEFLSPLLTPIRAGWNSQHQILTSSDINSISFDPVYTRALIDFQDAASALWESLYEKVDGQWIHQYTNLYGIP